MQPDKTTLHAKRAGSAAKFVVIEDDLHEDKWPLRFRYTDAPLKLNKKEMTGFRELNLIGSGQPSEKQLVKIIKKSDKPVVVVDLRQEPHGYIAGVPITWFRPYISDQELGTNAMMSLQNSFISSMKKRKTVEVNAVQWTKGQEYRITHSLKLESATPMSEKDLSKNLGIGYKRFYIAVTPTTQQVKEFEDFVAEMDEKDVALYFHCWDGSGRTTEFMTMYDIIKNGKNVPIDTIVKRQAAIGGIDINKLPLKKNDPIYQRSLKRKQFIRHYYEAITRKDV